MSSTTSQQWILQHPPTGIPTISGPKPTFTLASEELPPLTPGQVLVKALYFSNDPAQRGWIDHNIAPERLYVPPVQIGHPMRSRALGEVLESTCDIPKGSIVRCTLNWRTLAAMSSSEVQVLPPLRGISISHWLGALGNTGLTAYYGIVKIAEAKMGETVVVSGAAGATGSMVVQIAKKMLGAGKVVGIAGGANKCKWVEKIGADICEYFILIHTKSIPTHSLCRC